MLALLAIPAGAAAQVAGRAVGHDVGTADATVRAADDALSTQDRREWVVESVVSPQSLGAAVALGAWHSAVDAPREWNGSSGFARRILAAQADTAISTGVEASLGALWGEDPRPIASGRRGTGERIGFALKTVVLAPRRDGHLAPAWGRLAGITVSSTVQNAWLPPRLTTPRETLGRVAGALGARLAVNLLREFAPDLRRRLPFIGHDDVERSHGARGGAGR